MPRCFKKENLHNVIRFNGSIIYFEPVGGNVGVIQLDESHDAARIAELDRLADARRMGVVRINADIIADLKKKGALLKSHPAPGAFQKIRIADRDLIPQKPREAVSTSAAGHAASKAAAAIPAPMPPPVGEEFKPKRARKSAVEKAAVPAAS
jgi:hypothetical protein